MLKNTPPLKKHGKPDLKWQVKEYARVQELRFHLPYGFLLLCKLWNTTPDDILTDFMDNLSCGSWKREGRDEAKINLQQYVKEMNYGQQHYSKRDIQQMFIELDAIGLLWPVNAKEKVRNLHVKWRDKYYNWWFKKWKPKNYYKDKSLLL